MKFAALLITAVSALAVRATSLDVWTPVITFPSEGVELFSYVKYNFTWDASSPPAQITNKVAVIYLRQNDQTLPVIIGGNVPITQGWVEVTIPWVTNGTYQAVLFGDSGNFSPEFRIHGLNPFNLNPTN